eukprot:1943883-Karenia_brevis.AAC.1
MQLRYHDHGSALTQDALACDNFPEPDDAVDGPTPSHVSQSNVVDWNRSNSLHTIHMRPIAGRCPIRAIMAECSTCQQLGFLSSLARIHIVQDFDVYRCQRCYQEFERDGVEVHPAQFRDQVIASRGPVPHDHDEVPACIGVGLGTYELLNSFYLEHENYIAAQGGPFSLGQWIKAVQQGRLVPMAAEATRMLHIVRECCVQGCLPALEMKLGWILLLLGDGHLLKSLALKR